MPRAANSKLPPSLRCGATGKNPAFALLRRGRQKSKLTRLVPALLDWFYRNARDLPWRSCKARRDPYAIWVSEIMLQQTQVKTVAPYWKRWLRELPTIKALAKARPEKIHKLWEGLGYYTRVRNLQKAARLFSSPSDFLRCRRCASARG